MADLNGDTDGDIVASIDFCTLGMFIIDDIYPPPTAPDQTPRMNIIGGAGTFSALGARLLSPGPLSQSIGWIVDTGTDFPSTVREELESWNTSLLFRRRKDGELTTRGWNGYTGSNDHRDFKYLTTKKRLTPHDLTPQLLRAKSLHLICSPTRCVEMCEQLLALRASASIPDRPVVIWEPVPDSCTPTALPEVYKALKHVDIISPNHEELASLFSFTHPVTGDIDREAVESQSFDLLNHGVDAVVVRCGKEGCYIASLSPTPPLQHWLPAYHQDPSRVLDPTGGGNGFLGGLAVGFVRSRGDLVEAGKCGNVAASFCVEQVGVPKLTLGSNGEENWNGENVRGRLEEYQRRTDGRTIEL